MSLFSHVSTSLCTVIPILLGVLSMKNSLPPLWSSPWLIKPRRNMPILETIPLDLSSLFHLIFHHPFLSASCYQLPPKPLWLYDRIRLDATNFIFVYEVNINNTGEYDEFKLWKRLHVPPFSYVPISLISMLQGNSVEFTVWALCGGIRAGWSTAG